MNAEVSEKLIMMYLDLFCVFVIISLFVWYLYYLYCFTYWKRKGVPTHPPSFPAGNITSPVTGRENLFTTVENFYHEFKNKGYKHGGLYFFNGPVYLPVDPGIVKSILSTDFEHFVDRGVFINLDKFPLSAHLFSQTGQEWKHLRNKLSPTFTSGKLKTMYEIFMKTTDDFIKTIEPAAGREEEINIKYVSSNFTCDLICNTAFGVHSGTLEDPENKVSQITHQIFDPPNWLFFKSILLNGLQKPGDIIHAQVSNKTVENFFRNLVDATIKYRKETKIARADFMSLLLEVEKNEGLSFNEILAQCFLFFLAGFETSSQTISFCIHELAHNQDLQDKLRAQIHENLGKDYRNYSYEDIFKLPYLDKVFKETLRLHPVLGFLNRICVKPYKVPGTDVTIEEGTPVLISLLGLQRDPEYFPEPLKFNPDRFNEEQTHVPFTFMPFGEGPRFCIGKRYGQLQTKLGIAALISQFKFFPSQETPKYIELDPLIKSLVMVPKKGITVKVTKLS